MRALYSQYLVDINCGFMGPSTDKHNLTNAVSPFEISTLLIFKDRGGIETGRMFDVICGKAVIDTEDVKYFEAHLAARKFSAAMKIIITYSQILSLMLTIVSSSNYITPCNCFYRYTQLVMIHLTTSDSSEYHSIACFKAVEVSRRGQRALCFGEQFRLSFSLLLRHLWPSSSSAC